MEVNCPMCGLYDARQARLGDTVQCLNCGHLWIPVNENDHPSAELLTETTTPVPST